MSSRKSAAVVCALRSARKVLALEHGAAPATYLNAGSSSGDAVADVKEPIAASVPLARQGRSMRRPGMSRV